jgi:hypothetical protein
LIEYGIIKALINNLQEFKETDKIMQEIYAYYEPTYNFFVIEGTFQCLN